MKDGALSGASIGLRCAQCGTTSLAEAATLWSRLDGQLFSCSCGEKTPVDIAYYEAIGTTPYVNLHFICNYVWGRVAKAVPLGRVHRIVLPEPLDRMHYVIATANATFYAHVAVVEQSGAHFSIVAACATDDAPTQTVPVAWQAAGWVGPPRPMFIEIASRAFEVLFEKPLRTPAMHRGALIDMASAYEAFAAWYLKEHVWVDTFFSSSKGKADLISELITRAGIALLTQVPIRTALGTVDLYRVFRALGLPISSGGLNRDMLLQRVLSGITLRNAVAHRGEENPDRKGIEDFIRAAYFLMEAVLLDEEEEMAVGSSPGPRHAEVIG